jgi:monovalent cation/proton antiporter MnhG/PhaG subunit
VSDAIVWSLLAAGVAAQLVAVLGLLVASDAYDRLHFTSPSAIFGPSCFALAVVIDEGPLSQAGLKSMLVALLLLALSPVLVHATARAVYVHERGSLELPEDARS